MHLIQAQINKRRTRRQLPSVDLLEIRSEDHTNGIRPSLSASQPNSPLLALQLEFGYPI